MELLILLYLIKKNILEFDKISELKSFICNYSSKNCMNLLNSNLSGIIESLKKI